MFLLKEVLKLLLLPAKARTLILLTLLSLNILTCVDGEESSVMTATASCAQGSEVIDNIFESQVDFYSNQLVIDLGIGIEKKMHTVFVFMDHYDDYEHELGDSRIYVGNTNTPWTEPAARSNVSSSGFFALEAITSGQFIGLK